MIDFAKMADELGNEFTKTMRVHIRVYDELLKLKVQYGKQNDLRRVTLNQFLTECCHVAKLVMEGEELYEANGKLFSDEAEAWGEASIASVRDNKAVIAPQILLRMGQARL